MASALEMAEPNEGYGTGDAITIIITVRTMLVMTGVFLCHRPVQN